MSDLPKEIKAFQAGLKLALPPKPEPEIKSGRLWDTGIRPALDKHLLDEAAKLRDYGEYFSASQAGYCMRKVIFERLGVPHIEKDGDARKQRVFSSGHIFHEWIQKLTKEAGLSIAQELELQDEDLMIRGHIDDLVLVGEPIVSNHKAGMVVSGNFVPKQHLILYDYKTQNSRAFSYKRPDMSYYHKMQLGTYMYMLRKQVGLVKQDSNSVGWVGKDLTEARILLISKDDLRMKEQQLIWDDRLASEIKAYWTALNKYWNEKKLPKCTCADREGGFMALEKWNPFYYEGEPCSLKWYRKWKEQKNDIQKPALVN